MRWHQPSGTSGHDTAIQNKQRPRNTLPATTTTTTTTAAAATVIALTKTTTTTPKQLLDGLWLWSHSSVDSMGAVV
ncbi:hypothetical protein ACLKA6_000254 [Drosophila palustris]